MVSFFANYPHYVVAFLQFVFLVIGMILAAKYVTRSDCEKCRQRLDQYIDELDKRVTRNEDKLNDLPTGDEVSALTVALESLSGDVRVLAERIEGVRMEQRATKELTNRLDIFLRNKQV